MKQNVLFPKVLNWYNTELADLVYSHVPFKNLENDYSSYSSYSVFIEIIGVKLIKINLTL